MGGGFDSLAKPGLYRSSCGIIVTPGPHGKLASLETLGFQEKLLKMG